MNKPTTPLYSTDEILSIIASKGQFYILKNTPPDIKKQLQGRVSQLIADKIITRGKDDGGATSYASISPENRQRLINRERNKKRRNVELSPEAMLRKLISEDGHTLKIDGNSKNKAVSDKMRSSLMELVQAGLARKEGRRNPTFTLTLPGLTNKDAYKAVKQNGGLNASLDLLRETYRKYRKSSSDDDLSLLMARAIIQQFGRCPGAGVIKDMLAGKKTIEQVMEATLNLPASFGNQAVRQTLLYATGEKNTAPFSSAPDENSFERQGIVIKNAFHPSPLADNDTKFHAVLLSAGVDPSVFFNTPPEHRWVHFDDAMVKEKMKGYLDSDGLIIPLGKNALSGFHAVVFNEKSVTRFNPMSEETFLLSDTTKNIQTALNDFEYLPELSVEQNGRRLAESFKEHKITTPVSQSCALQVAFSEGASGLAQIMVVSGALRKFYPEISEEHKLERSLPDTSVNPHRPRL